MQELHTPRPSAQDAVYHEQAIPMYRGNPFIEALPPLLERDEARALISVIPFYDESMRSDSAITREMLASTIAAIRQPTWLLGELYSRLSRLICNGYVSRNPAQVGFNQLVHARTGIVDERGLVEAARIPEPRMNGAYYLQANIPPTSNGLTFLGTSGIGKSSAMDMVLGLWPQLILHSEYGGRPLSRVQIVWMKLDAPSDGSVLDLGKKFFTKLDELHASVGLQSSYRKTFIKSRTSETDIAPDMARVAQQVGLGVLVLDDIQDLTPAKSRKFLSFLVQLVNAVGVSVVLVGGLDAFPLVTEQFRQVRRGSTEGDLVVTPSQLGRRWRDFCKVLWQYQFTTEWAELTDEHATALFNVSQGITKLLVIAHKNAQIRAITNAKKRVTPKIIELVSDTLSLAQPALGAIRRRSAFVMDRMSDLKVPSGVVSQPFLSADDLPSGPKPGTAGAERNADKVAEPAAAAAEPRGKLLR